MPENIDHKITLFSLLNQQINKAAKEGEAFETTLGHIVRKINDAANETSSFEKAMGNIEDIAKKVEEATGIAFNVEKIVEFGKKIAEVTMEYDGLFDRVKAYSANASDAAANTAFIKREVTELHLPMKQVVERFSDLEMGLKSTGIEGQRLRNLFHGISAAAVSMSMPDEQVKSTLDNLKEIGESGLTETTVKGLRGALPEIDTLVQQTFGKTLNELEGHISGDKFLQKIGPALETQFQSGLQGWGDSLQAKMNDRSNAITTTMIEMGDNLKPVFLEIETTMENTLKSDSLHWFVKNIREIISVAGTAIEVWAIYKGLMLANTILTKTFAYDNGLLTISLGKSTVMLEGSTVAVEGMSAALTAIPWVGLAASIALIVNKFTDWNEQIDNTVEGITHISQLRQRTKSLNEEREKASTDYRNFLAGKLTKKEASSAYMDVSQLTDKMHKEYVDNQDHLAQQVTELKGLKNKFAKNVKNPLTGNNRSGLLQSDEDAQLPSAIKNAEKNIAFLQRDLPRQHDAYVDLLSKKYTYEKMGVKPPTYSTPPPGEDQEDKKSKTRAEGQKVQTFNITIGDLIKDFTIATTNLSEAPAKVREMIVQALLSAVNDSQVAAGY